MIVADLATTVGYGINFIQRERLGNPAPIHID
jgi:hypothetical protein